MPDDLTGRAGSLDATRTASVRCIADSDNEGVTVMNVGLHPAVKPAMSVAEGLDDRRGFTIDEMGVGGNLVIEVHPPAGGGCRVEVRQPADAADALWSADVHQPDMIVFEVI